LIKEYEDGVEVKVAAGRWVRNQIMVEVRNNR
jgi:hypothetical protein